MQKCSRCKVIKTQIEFSFKNKVLGRISNICRACHAEYSREYAKRIDKTQRNTRIHQNTKRLRERNRLYVNEYKRSRTCRDCGQNDPLLLEFDHVRGTKVAAIAEMVRSCASLEKLKEEIAKCELRCGNCHRMKTLERIGVRGRNEKLLAL